MPNPNEILAALKSVRYPGFTRDIVSFGLVKDIEVASSRVTVILNAPSVKPEIIAQIVEQVSNVVAAMPGVPDVEVQVERAASQGAMPQAMTARRSIEGVRHVIAVASGKGGVGKSTVAVNLAIAMSALGRRIGLMDADIYGPSLAMMVGADGSAEITPERRITPIDRFGIRYVSMGLFVDDDTAIVWRGPMIAKAEAEFLFNVQWGELDCLVLDLPPGTGDAQLTITQRVALDGGVIVTTPQALALLDVHRGVTMFSQVGVPVLGVIENMSYHLCQRCGARHEIFAHGGGSRLAQSLGVPFLGELPISAALRQGGDRGQPLVAVNPEHEASRPFRAVAETILAMLDKGPDRST
jgi:ATP-binding protein involved in chromosome partitioning